MPNLSQFIENIASPDRLINEMIALVLASMVGFATGPIFSNANPVFWTVLDKLLGGMARKSYIPSRDTAHLMFRGTIFTLVFIFVGLGISLALGFVKTHSGQSAFFEIIFLMFCLSGGAIWTVLTKLKIALDEGKKISKGSYLPTAVSTRINLNSTDDFGIIRVGVGYMPVNFDKGMIAPLFWYLIGGLPLLYFYSAIACAKWALAKEGYSKGFGDLAVRLEKILGVIPSFISGIILMCAALFTPSARITRAIPTFFTGKGKAEYAEGGLPLSVTARALNVTLGGPVEDLEGSVIQHKWIGAQGATAKLDKSHILKAIYMGVMAHVLTFSLLVALLLLMKIISAY